MSQQIDEGLGNDLEDWPVNCFCFAPVKPVKVCKMPHVCPGSMVKILLPNQPPLQFHSFCITPNFAWTKRPKPTWRPNMLRFQVKNSKAHGKIQETRGLNLLVGLQEVQVLWRFPGFFGCPLLVCRLKLGIVAIFKSFKPVISSKNLPPGHSLDLHSEEVVLVAASTTHAWFQGFRRVRCLKDGWILGKMSSFLRVYCCLITKKGSILFKLLEQLKSIHDYWFLSLSTYWYKLV